MNRDELTAALHQLADEWAEEAEFHSGDEHKSKIFSQYGAGECDMEERMYRDHAETLRRLASPEDES